MLLVACTPHRTSLSFGGGSPKSQRGKQAMSIFIVGLGALIAAVAATGNLDDSEDGVGNSTEARVGFTALGLGMVGLGIYLWPSPPAPAPDPAPAPSPPPGPPAGS